MSASGTRTATPTWWWAHSPKTASAGLPPRSIPISGRERFPIMDRGSGRDAGLLGASPLIRFVVERSGDAVQFLASLVRNIQPARQEVQVALFGRRPAPERYFGREIDLLGGIL